ncbi:partial Polysialic acid transport protein KpsD, partial [Anaerolineae bacterium]
MRKELLRQTLLSLLVLFSVLVTGLAEAAENPCDGPMREEAMKHGFVCPEAKKQPETKAGEKPSQENEKPKKEEAKPLPDLFRQLAMKENRVEAAKLKTFGQGVFSGSEAAAPESLPLSPEYPVGFGDEIGVVFWGRVTGEHVIPVTREGTITIPMLGTLIVNGLTYGEVRELVTRKVKSVIGAEVS